MLDFHERQSEPPADWRQCRRRKAAVFERLELLLPRLEGSIEQAVVG
jgi:hypothetical protein